MMTPINPDEPVPDVGDFRRHAPDPTAAVMADLMSAPAAAVITLIFDDGESRLVRTVQTLSFEDHTDIG